uniref:Endonuclease/exonuclease/phosphatase domain-containing protein n=1 Tax=Anopheles atroparvus TaxID=41427 RepID=A0A182JIL5_ANOAO
MEAVVTAVHGCPRVILAGHFNAAASEWGEPPTSQRQNRHQPRQRRGEELLATAELLGLRLLNRGNTPSFLGRGVARPSIIDVTFASRSIASGSDWKVLGDFTNNDHRAVSFSVASQRPSATGRDRRPAQQCRRWDATLFIREVFVSALRLHRSEEAARDPTALIRIMTKACDETMPRNNTRVGPPRATTNAYWWTEEIAQLRRT